MTDITILVLAPRADPRLALLAPPPPGVSFVVGERVDDFGASLDEAKAVLAWTTGRAALDPVLERAKRLVWVHSSAAGLDHLLSPTLVAHPAVLTNSRGVFSRSLAEFVLAAILHFAKEVPRLRRQQAAGVWEVFDLRMVEGATLGVIGYGDIGRAAAALARAVGMRVVAQRRRPELSRDDGIPSALHARIEPVLEAADYLLLATPLTPSSRRMIGPAELARLKPDAVLINVGRGGVVDEPALVAALERGGLRGAALDVFETEPLPEGHPFFRMDNVLVSPHCADHVAGWLEASMRLFLENVSRFVRGEPLSNVADKHEGY
jgi:phosphoglycerate dehydrogenase-like enzyme